MNDLAEKALDGLVAARREVRGHPMLSLAGAGFLVCALVVVAGGQADAVEPNRALTSWLGLQDVRDATTGHAPGAIMLAGALTMIVLWVTTWWVVVQQRQPPSRVWWVAGAWAIPFVVGPPVMDTSVYTYVAYGRLQRDGGHNPYLSQPSDLGNSPIVTAIDPAFRSLSSSAGSLGTVLEHLAISVSGGRELAAVIVWRAIGVVAAVWIARSAAELGGAHRAGALAAVALNPLLLLYCVCSPHLDAVLAALVLAALVAARQRQWWRALVLAALGGTVLGPGFVVVPMIAAGHWFGRRRLRWWPVAVRDLLVIAVTVAAATLVQPDGLGWLRTARAQFAPEQTPYSLSGAAEKALSVVVRAASYDDLAAGGRLTAVVAAGCTVIYLLVTSRLRPLEASVGYALLAVALLAPALNPWYLLWGVLPLLPSATGQARICLIGISAAGCVLAPPGFVGVPAHAATGACLALVAAATGTALWLSRPEPSTPVPPLAAGAEG